MKTEANNPITKLDYPDIDVIRVDDTYYMVSTTMHFMPGCEILRSYDLANWEHAAYVYDRLDGTPGQTLAGGEYLRQRHGGRQPALSSRGFLCLFRSQRHKKDVFVHI